MYQRAYGKSGFDWSLPPSKGQTSKGHNSSFFCCCDRVTNPLFCLIIFLSTFLALSVLVFSLSEYWALETGSALECAPPGAQGPLGSMDSANFKPWEFSKDKAFLLVASLDASKADLNRGVRIATWLVHAEAQVWWLTTQEATPGGAVRTGSSLEKKVSDLGVKILDSSTSKQSAGIISSVDSILLLSVEAGSFLEAAPPTSLSRTVWLVGRQQNEYLAKKAPWLRKMPRVAAVLVQSEASEAFWKGMGKSVIGEALPLVRVVPPSISPSALLASDDSIGRSMLRCHVRDSAGVGGEAPLVLHFGAQKSSVELFLKSFKIAFQTHKKSKKESMQALVVGPMDLATQFSSHLKSNGLATVVRFQRHLVDAVPYLTAGDVLVVNSQEKGEDTIQSIIDSFALEIPVLSSSVGENVEVVKNKTNGILHKIGNEGIHSLARNIVSVIEDGTMRGRLTRAGRDKVKTFYLESQFAERLGIELKQVLESVESTKPKKGKKRKKRVKLVVEVVK